MVSMKRWHMQPAEKLTIEGEDRSGNSRRAEGVIGLSLQEQAAPSRPGRWPHRWAGPAPCLPCGELALALPLCSPHSAHLYIIHKGLDPLFPMLYSVGLLTNQPIAKKLQFRAADSQALSRRVTRPGL